MNLQLFAEKDILNQKSKSLKTAIRKYYNKISYPMYFYPEWDSYSTQRQKGLKRHWKKEINIFWQSINDRVEELKKRGDYDESED